MPNEAKTFLQQYQALFDTFTQERGLDEDDLYWSEEQRNEFKIEYEKLRELHSPLISNAQNSSSEHPNED
jgi:hypothetical protein